jgi:CubicO group peptidase (beta-lactamase class C family)
MAIPALTSIATFGAKTVGAAVLDSTGVIEVAGETDARLPLASVTKPLVAYAALVAVEEGTIALDDPAGPEGSTVAHLLAHASGLAPDDPTRILAKPGTHRIYSSAGYAVLAAHIEQASGFSMAAYLADAIFEPLRMRHSALVGPAGMGAVSTVEDLTQFAGELLAPGLISAETFALATSPAFPGLGGVLPGFGRQEPCDFGLGFEIRDHKAPHWTGSLNSPATFGHFGQSGTFLWVDPVASLALIVLTDRPFGDWAAAAWPPLSDEVVAAYPGPH